MLKGIMRKIAIVTNVLLVMQFAFLGAGSAYAAESPVPVFDKTALYENDSTEMTVSVVTPGDYVTIYVADDETDYDFIGSYIEGGINDEDGTKNGKFIKTFDYSDFSLIAPITNKFRVYETNDEISDGDGLEGLVPGIASIDMKIGFKFPIVEIASPIVYQNEQINMKVKISEPGNHVTFFASSDGTNYEVLGHSYREGGFHDVDGVENGELSIKINYSDFPLAPTKYIIHAYEYDGHLGIDELNYLEFTVANVELKKDLAAPTFTISVDPSAVTDVTKTTTLVVKPNEKLKPDTLKVWTKQLDGAPIEQTARTWNTEGTICKVVLSELIAGDNQLIKVFVGGSDMYGNSKAIELAKEDFSFMLDTKAPDPVTNLTATYSETSGSVTLSWTNPTSDYLYVEVRRDGLPISEQLVKTTTSYTDYYTVRGKTYSYNVIVYDAAGNKCETAPVSVTIPPAKVAVVASGVSDSYSYGYASVSASDEAVVSTEAVDTEATDEDSKEVKADDVATGEDDSNTASEKDFPTWGIIALIFLLALGGYLFWVQKPEENEPTVYVEKKSGNGKGKKKQK